MNWLSARLLPLLSVLIAALVGVLPWGQGDKLSFLFPTAVFMVVHFWHHRHAALVSPFVVAVVGLGIDILTSGPLGFWPFVLLIGMAMTRLMARLPSGHFAAEWLSFAAACGVLSLTAWLVASAYFIQVVDWRPMVVAAAVQLVAYPLIALVLTPLEDAVRQPRVSSFTRGG